MPITLEDCHITSYQLGVLVAGADAFDFSQLTSGPTDMRPWTVTHATNSSTSGDTFEFKLTTEPTAEMAKEMDWGSTPLAQLAINGNSRAETDIGDLAIDPNNPNNGSTGLVVIGDTNVTGQTPEWTNFRSSDPGTPGPDDDADDGLVLPAVQDDGLLLPAVQTGGVSVASGDVNGDNCALGDPVTFTFTVRPASAAPGPDGTSNTLMIGEYTEGSSRLFVGNLKMNSEDSIPATEHVAISLGDGKAIEAAADDYGIGEWSDPAQPAGGTNMSPWTVTHESGNRANPDTFDCSELTQWASGTAREGGVRKGDWITDVTFEPLETGAHALYQDAVIPTLDTGPAIAMETLTIGHEGWLI